VSITISSSRPSPRVSTVSSLMLVPFGVVRSPPR
jgi:hypothetical protein